MPQQSNALTLEIIKLCRELGFVRSELSGGVCVELPTWEQFKKTLPPSGAQAQVRAFHKIQDYVQGLCSIPDKRRRWKLWHNGSFRIDNTLPKNSR